MDGHRRRIDALFDAALDLPASERAAYLDTHAPEPEVRAAVERLLESTDETASILDADAAWRGEMGVQMAAALRLEPAREGERIGPYRVVRELGRGGMASVYLAKRADGHFDQQVALKLATTVGPDQAELVRRFHLERQILASLDHPNIARLVDGGLTDDGRPFFAMELVEGQPIDRYCDDARLPITDRIRLMIDVARAVEAAHRALIVHRDIKPSNVLVTTAGLVKLLDFGIAKQVTDSDLTRTAGAVMTPEYASPEQFRGELVTTASDVYQLGLLLYQLLAGERPYRVAGLSPTDAERVICTDAPERPSTRLQRMTRASTEALEAVSRLRRTRPSELRRLLSGDLDTLVMTALRKEPERRYRSAGELADDLESFLEGRPIRARGDSTLYLAQKFFHRHRAAVVTALLVAALLVGVIAFYTTELARERNAARLEARRAAEARDEAVAAREEAEKTADFLVELFDRSDPWNESSTEVTARQLLDEGAAELHNELTDQPLTRARLLGTIGLVYRRLGLFDQARPLLEEAHDLHRRHLDPDHPDLAESLYNLAYLHFDLGDAEAAGPLFERSVEIRRRHFGPRSLPLSKSLHGLSQVARKKGRYDEAEKLLDQVLDIELEHYGPRHIEIASTLANLANIYHFQGREQEALELGHKVVDLEESLLGPDHMRLSVALNNLGTVYDRMGHEEKAVEHYERALAIKEKNLGPDHPLVAGGLINLGSAVADVGRYAEAEAMLLRAAGILEAIDPPDHHRLGNVYTNIASLAYDHDDLDRAEENFERAYEHRLDLHGHLHPDIGASHFNFGDLYLRQNRRREAAAAFEKALDIWRQTLRENHPYLGFGLTALAEIRHQEGRHAEAEKLYAEAVDILTAKVAPTHDMRQRAVRGYATLLEELGRGDQAATLLTTLEAEASS